MVQQPEVERGFRAARLAIALLIASSAPAQQGLPLEPFHDTGQSATPSFEGWFQNADGTFSILFGYYNRNQKEEIDIPLGPNNRIEPGGPDRGQPTHFIPGRMWGVFTVTVPQDFGKDKLIWTLISAGRAAAIPASLDPLWELAPFKDATENTPPVVRFPSGASVQGPKPVTVELSAAAGTPLMLSVAVSDDARLAPGARKPKTPPATVAWSKYRGPGSISFSADRPPVQPDDPQPATGFSGKSSTTATFSEPGDYMLYLVANDWTGKGGGGFLCCWTNALVKVSVK
jgi:hypothetical protein